jgi:hypothetical protein
MDMASMGGEMHGGGFIQRADICEMAPRWAIRTGKMFRSVLDAQFAIIIIAAQPHPYLP